MPQKGGFEKNVKRAAAIGCRTVQIFPGNPTGWRMGNLGEKEIKRRSSQLAELGIYPLVIHCAYLINLASNSDEVLEKSLQLLDETMQRAFLYQAPFVVLHTGNHGGQGVEKGMTQVVESIARGLSRWPAPVKLLLENTAGSGTALGSSFEQLAQIVHSFPKANLGTCLDTAHCWAAGYDLSSATAVDSVLDHFDKTVGLANLYLIHANDTKVKCGARLDRHAHIGEGNITVQGFRAILNYGWPGDFPIILETPENGTDRDRDNMKILIDLTEK